MELYQIIEVNEPQQYLMLNAWIVERWYDKLLRWNPRDFGNVSEIMVPHHRIWLPDTTLYNSLVMEDRDTRRLLNAKLTTGPKGAYIELLYPTIYKLSCNLDLRFFPFDIQVCKLIFGSWTFDNTYIDYHPYNAQLAIGTTNCIENEGWWVIGTSVTRRVEKYAYKMPSTSSFIPLIGWFYTCMILLISLSTLLSSVIIYIQKQGILGKPPRNEVMRYARVVGRFVRMELPLLMRQAYAQKEDRLRKTQRARKETMWQKVYKLSKVSSPLTFKKTLQPNSHSQPKHLNKLGDEENGELPQEKPRKGINISQEVLKINGTNGVPEYTPMGDVDQDDDTGYIDGMEDVDLPPSKFLHKTSTSQSIDSALRLGVNLEPAAPRTPRNLAELEYDWLAAVVERVCIYLTGSYV
ncbi:unnamed protein product, partial [Mesorhabditis spiculigera]